MTDFANFTLAGLVGGRSIEVGDIVLCLKTRFTVGAIGVVTGDYEYTSSPPAGVRSDYVHKRSVRWLAKNIDLDITQLNGGRQLTLQTVYPLSRISWPDLLESLKKTEWKQPALMKKDTEKKEPYVLIIDEINRGNISRIFGELITLIEPSKRAGELEELIATLPYSKRPFSVPANVHLIGTMNTADRSLAGLDVALRRRFDFIEMQPRPDLLDKVSVGEIQVGQLLRTINLRIEALLDRDHVIGHAYFMPLLEDASIGKLGAIFRHKVLPLMQEYFFDDWQRIQWVFNDHRKSLSHQFVQSEPLNIQALFGDEVTVSNQRAGWKINDEAFELAQSYLGVMLAQQAS